MKRVPFLGFPLDKEERSFYDRGMEDLRTSIGEGMKFLTRVLLTTLILPGIALVGVHYYDSLAKNRVSLEQKKLEPLIAQRERMERLVAEMYRLIFPLKDMEIITRSKAESLFINYSQSTNPNDRKASTLWDIIYKMIGHRPIPNIFWELDGISEDETKFSPSGFIAYILQKAGKLNISIDSLKRCDDSKLREILINCSKEVHFSAVQSGDIVFYPSGNVMIYFNNYGKPGKGACVGMTPIGLIAVNPHFEMRMKNGLRRIPED